MSQFDKWKERYEKNWATKEQLQRLVTLRILTSKEYQMIVGDVNE